MIDLGAPITSRYARACSPSGCTNGSCSCKGTGLVEVSDDEVVVGKDLGGLFVVLLVGETFVSAAPVQAIATGMLATLQLAMACAKQDEKAASVPKEMLS